MLTEGQARKSSPKRKPYKLSDFGGLYLLINPRGSRWWRLKYRFGGKENCMSLGVYPSVSLAEARKRRDRVRAQLRSGIDPMISRRALRAKQQARRKARAFRLSMSSAGELSIDTPRQFIRLTTHHTEALRSFLQAEAEARSIHHAPE